MVLNAAGQTDFYHHSPPNQKANYFSNLRVFHTVPLAPSWEHLTPILQTELNLYIFSTYLCGLSGLFSTPPHIVPDFEPLNGKARPFWPIFFLKFFLQFLQLWPHIVPPGGVEAALRRPEAVGGTRRPPHTPERRWTWTGEVIESKP